MAIAEQQESNEVDWSDTDEKICVKVSNNIDEPEVNDIRETWTFEMVVGEKPTITRKREEFLAKHRIWSQMDKTEVSLSEYKDVAPDAVTEVFDGIYVE